MKIGIDNAKGRITAFKRTSQISRARSPNSSDCFPEYKELVQNTNSNAESEL